MIMHGTWYKGPQLAHHSHSEYHQFRSYPSFMVAPYHDTCTQLSISAASNNCLTPNGPAATPILLDNLPFAGGVNHQLLTTATVTGPPTTHLSSGHLTVLSPTIKIEQSFNEPLSSVEDYALNLECTTVDDTFKKPNNYIWPPSAAHDEHNNNLTGADAASLTLVTPNIPPTPPPDTQIHLDHNTKPVKDIQRTDATSTSFKSKIINRSSAELGVNSTSNTMPIGGVQGQNPTQGLVHWMSAVMAEHMTGQTHHDPTAVGMHYMWNGNVDQCTQHSKDIAEYNSWPPEPPTTLRHHHMSTKQGYEAKMNDHHNNLQKGHFLEDNRLDHHTVTAQGSILGSSGPVSHHGNHVNHHGSAAAAAALLVVPQPINATKIGSSLGGPGGGGSSATSGGTGRKYQCKMCPQIFTSKADLQLHTQIHMREAKPYKCTQCTKAFANSSYLSQHTRIHLGIKPYRCEICQRKFTQLSHLQQHIRTHTGDKPYKCRHPGCQKAFSQLSNLQSHSRCHQTDKPFKCNSCYKCFSDESSLLDHIPKHKESKHLKTHICQYCGKSYTQETYLTKHMQKHSERTDKRPPIVATNIGNPANTQNGAGSTGNNGQVMGGATGSSNNAPNLSGPGAGSGINVGVGGNINNMQHNRNNIALPAVSIASTDNSYWPKVSPDSAANIKDVIHQQQQQQHHHGHHQQTHINQQQQQQHHHQQQHQQQQHQQQQQQQAAQQHQPPSQQAQQQQQQQQQLSHMDYNALQNGTGAVVPPNSQHNDLHSHHRMNENGREDIVSTPSTVGPYDASNITKPTSNSAFTPINSMPPHLNTLSHHPMAQRPYLYDTISFPNKNINQSNASNAFPNQLISLHQIRNYAHQPSGLTMTGEHLLGVSVGPSKDKG